MNKKYLLYAIAPAIALALTGGAAYASTGPGQYGNSPDNHESAVVRTYHSNGNNGGQAYSEYKRTETDRKFADRNRGEDYRKLAQEEADRIRGMRTEFKGREHFKNGWRNGTRNWRPAGRK